MRKNNQFTTTQEKKKLLGRINQQIIEGYKKYNVPMIFKTNDCAPDEWMGMNLNTKHVLKLKFITTGEKTIIIEVASGKKISHF